MQSIKFLKFTKSRIIKMGVKYYIDSIVSDYFITYNQKKYFLISTPRLRNLGLRIPKRISIKSPVS